MRRYCYVSTLSTGAPSPNGEAEIQNARERPPRSRGPAAPYFAIAGVAGLMALLFLAERLVRLRPVTRPLMGRLLVNFAISATAFVVAALVVRPAATATLRWATSKPFGLVHLVPMPRSVQFIFSFLLLDLAFYWWHVANHRIRVLWRFHNVHHIDPDLDVFRRAEVEDCVSDFFRGGFGGRAAHGVTGESSPAVSWAALGIHLPSSRLTFAHCSSIDSA